MTNKEEVAMKLKDLFSNTVISLNIPKFENSYPLSENIDHPLKAIIKYRKHVSVNAILSQFTKERISSNTITIKDELKEISILGNSKVIQSTEIPIKVIKRNSNFFAEQICAYFNEFVSKGKFPNCLKLTNITSGFKKGAHTSKNNYRPVNTLPIFSKIFQKLLQKQLVLFNIILSKFEYSFRKEHVTQSCLLVMLEFFKDATDKSKAFGALPTDLSKAFDCLCYDLLIAKLHAYYGCLFVAKMYFHIQWKYVYM